jgi:hypothetical protein
MRVESTGGHLRFTGDVLRTRRVVTEFDEAFSSRNQQAVARLGAASGVSIGSLLHGGELSGHVIEYLPSLTNCQFLGKDDKLK